MCFQVARLRAEGREGQAPPRTASTPQHSTTPQSRAAANYRISKVRGTAPHIYIYVQGPAERKARSYQRQVEKQPQVCVPAPVWSPPSETSVASRPFNLIVFRSVADLETRGFTMCQAAVELYPVISMHAPGEAIKVPSRPQRWNNFSYFLNKIYF
jgi:hypothetical protein